MSGSRNIEQHGTTSTASKGSRKKAYHHNDLRNALLAEALKLIAERGGPVFSMRELASAVGVTHASAYRHFSDKAALLDALTAEGFRILAACQEEELEGSSDDPLERLNVLGSAYLRFALENKGFFSLMFTAREDEDPEQSSRTLHNEQALSTLVTCIKDCQRAGQIVEGDAIRIAGYIVLATHGLAVYLTQGHHPLGSGKAADFFPGINAVNELSVAPLLVNPPSPRDIARRWFPQADLTD
ncbi:DNA-binding transcriptional repressor AcrR [Sulfitobacter sp. THAF37]|nr:DNA-binding transcriptional repressor AcrR [Sulfitobacter sp. THAF37]